ncbi:NfeD family protein [uncultured Clostridium sp.]|uniref:NfeD family protein n=1 Tax=uncultured Clostridium sp. TaxID=59620 RepID=UPI0025CD386A|nr:NfeD family protein [uncultured Clostridium sp.]MDU4882118.1 NfeD family protein [Clostridium celatum]MDU7075286.1 NfeD family protein [Clostridium celatum]
MVEVIIWILVAIFVIAIDVVTSSFIFMWLSIGALAAIILSLLGISVLWQIIAFLIVGVVTISIGYPWAKKKFKADVNQVLTMEQTYIGKEMVATEDMRETSKIKVSGIYWTAYNKGKTIKKGEKYTITGIEGNKLIVSLKED